MIFRGGVIRRELKPTSRKIYRRFFQFRALTHCEVQIFVAGHIQSFRDTVAEAFDFFGWWQDLLPIVIAHAVFRRSYERKQSKFWTPISAAQRRQPSSFKVSRNLILTSKNVHRTAFPFKGSTDGNVVASIFVEVAEICDYGPEAAAVRLVVRIQDFRVPSIDVILFAKENVDHATVVLSLWGKSVLRDDSAGCHIPQISKARHHH